METDSGQPWLCGKFVRDEPTQAALCAFTAGLLLNFIPVRAIVLILTGLLLRAGRPALIFLGLLKVSEFFRRKNNITLAHHD